MTAAFNLNILHVVNRTFGADFDSSRFSHRAIFDEPAGRIEMRLVSAVDHAVHLCGRRFRFAAGEHLVTEYSHKYRIDAFQSLARQAGWMPEQVWQDDRGWFSVQYFRAVA